MEYDSITGLPIPVKDLKTIKRFPPSLRGTLYEKMLEAISEELSIWRNAIFAEKTAFYDVDNLDKDGLKRLADLFAVPFMVDVLDDIDFLREEIRAIPFKLSHKGSVSLYRSLFYAVRREGELFTYMYQDDASDIIPSMENPFIQARVVEIEKGMQFPFRFISKNNFSGYINDVIRLDTGRVLDISNTDVPWRLDAKITDISTCHIGMEYFIDRIIERNAHEFLMTNEYLNYIDKNMSWGKRVKEVPHIGSQLSIQVAAKGIPKIREELEQYTIPSLHLMAFVRDDFFSTVLSKSVVDSVEFGVGKYTLDELENIRDNIGDKFPCELKARVCSKKLISSDKFGSDTPVGIGMVGRYTGQLLNNISIDTDIAFDGINSHFEFILPYAPIRRGSVFLSFNYPDKTVLAVNDDGNGELSSANGKGSIDYSNGKCVINTKFEYDRNEYMDEIKGFYESDWKNNNIAGELIGKDIIPGTVLITFMANDRLYTVRDTPDIQEINMGRFSYVTQAGKEIIKSGEINYSTGDISVEFDDIVDLEQWRAVIRYTHSINYAPPISTKLTASYFFTERTINITEAGFRDNKGRLIAYASFPPFEFRSSNYHLSFLLLARENQ